MPSPRRRLAAIMFTDLAGFTSHTHGDEKAGLQLLREQERLVRPVLEAYRGRTVKSMGDGLLIEFGNALDAVNCAVEVQRRAHERNAVEGVVPLRIRIGIHLGDVERRGADIIGDSVNIASRIEPLAEAGGVCFSGRVFDQVHNKLPIQIVSLGLRNLKGIREPIEIYRVALPWVAGSSPGGEAGPPRIAVLPLANISPNPEDEYFADGLTDELISVLSQIRGFRVISRTSVNQYRGASKSAAQIGYELGANAILEGSVRKAGDRLRIGVQLIDPRSDVHLWTQTFDRKFENVFAIQSEVAEQAAAALRVRLGRSEREAIDTPPTANLAAYGLYLQGLHATYSSDVGGTERAVAFFEQAVRTDPGFALAYAHLGISLVSAAGESRPAEEAFPRARDVTLRALELDPDSAEAHIARGNLALQAERDWGLAEAEFRRALALNPSSSTARLWLGILLYSLQRYSEAKVQFREGLALDPALPFLPLHLVRVLLHTGELESALAVAEGGVARFPLALPVRVSRGLVHMCAGRLAEAEEDIDAAIRLASGGGEASAQVAEARVWLAFVRFRKGDSTAARALREEWSTDPAKRPLSVAFQAGLLAIAEDADAALELLEQSVRGGQPDLWFSYQAPLLDGLRDNPRFQTLLQELNLPTTDPWIRPVATLRDDAAGNGSDRGITTPATERRVQAASEGSRRGA